MEHTIGAILKADIRNASLVSQDLIEHQEFSDPLEEICYYTSTEFDVGKAHFVSETNSVESEIIKLRLLVLNGDFKTAQHLLSQATQLKDDESKAEFYLAEAQVLGHENNWAGVISVAEAGLRLKPAHITRISLLQCRAMALYELGYFDQGLTDCEMILSQKELYPSAVSVRYAYILKQKIFLAKDQSLMVKKVLENFWNEMENQKRLNLDSLLSLLRLQIDYNRSEKLPIRSLALFSYLVAYELSDKLYQAFALIDWYSTFPNPDPSTYEKIKNISSSFKKSELFFNEFLMKKSSITSTKRIIETVGEGPCGEGDKIPHKRFIILVDRNLSLDLRSKTLCSLSKTINWRTIKDLFAQGPVDKKLFFEKIWNQKYFYQKHDGVIRAFIYRLKKRTGIKIHSENGKMIISDCLFV